MLTPFFKVIAISRHEIKVVYSNGVKVRYKRAPSVHLYDENAQWLNEFVNCEFHYRAHVQQGVVSALQRNLNISEGNACWNCQ